MLYKQTGLVVVGLIASTTAGVLVGAGQSYGAIMLTVPAGCVLALLCTAKHLPRIFLTAVSIILLGYAFLGRGFAYLGIPPVYIGELILGLGIIMLMTYRGFTRIWRLPLSISLTLYIVWGAVRTVPYVTTYGLDSLRDGVVWAYSLYALAVGCALVWTRSEQRVAQWYGRWLPLLLVWAPVAAVIYRLFLNALPRWPWGPGGGVPVLGFKGGDVAVHLSGAMAFLVLGLRHRRGAHGHVGEWVCWLAWCVAFMLVAFTGRAAFLTVAAAGLAVAALRPVSRWVRPVALGTAIVLLGILSGFELDLGTARKVSVEQLAINLASLVSNTGESSVEGSKQWRLAWWQTIVGYTVFGPYFWTGKGFGINLADDDGFQVYADHSLRSPHNSHLTILARAGVPGFVLWLVLQLNFAVRLLVAYRMTQEARKDELARHLLWIFVYWIAFMINATFDVFLEGPQGGIWFWCLFGYGMALLYRSRYENRGASAQPLPAVRW